MAVSPGLLNVSITCVFVQAYHVQMAATHAEISPQSGHRCPASCVFVQVYDIMPRRTPIALERGRDRDDLEDLPSLPSVLLCHSTLNWWLQARGALFRTPQCRTPVTSIVQGMRSWLVGLTQVSSFNLLLLVWEVELTGVSGSTEDHVPRCLCWEADASGVKDKHTMDDESNYLYYGFLQHMIVGTWIQLKLLET
ncbi:unnamed protein product [Fusarium venenatum]|uniref:Uncharacterized protein n=1 Tax=Fusarium venenatum TaxID=56646 RepID=A0A2L2T4S4_9HYPO|nr:uncharacterized protein FVRRES_07129 [Fusarium venenatum]CEI62693.1 unnamed protein product [Fusarium venenatum]